MNALMPVNINRLPDIITQDSKTVRLWLILDSFSEYLSNMLGYFLKQIPHVIFIFAAILQKVLTSDEIPR